MSWAWLVVLYMGVRVDSMPGHPCGLGPNSQAPPSDPPPPMPCLLTRSLALTLPVGINHPVIAFYCPEVCKSNDFDHVLSKL